MPIFRSPLSIDSPDAIFARSHRRSSAAKAVQPHYAAAPWPDIAPPRTDTIPIPPYHLPSFSGWVQCVQMPAKKANGRLSSKANQTGERAPSGNTSFSEKLVQGTTQRFSIASQRRQCGDLTLRTLVTPVAIGDVHIPILVLHGDEHDAAWPSGFSNSPMSRRRSYMCPAASISSWDWPRSVARRHGDVRERGFDL